MTRIREGLEALGAQLGPHVVAACRDLFASEQEPLAAALPPCAVDCAYGPDPRHRLDLYRKDTSEKPFGGDLRPVLLFVHGGGFVLGDKGGPNDAGGWQNAHVARWAARCGMLGAAMNYRLAPDHVWPSGAQDVASAVEWLRANAASHGGDPDRIVLVGTSAGAIHIAGYLSAVPGHVNEVRAAVLLSGLYGASGIDAKDQRYYGAPEDYPDRMPWKAVEDTQLPLFLACARFDPPRFQAEWTALMAARLERHGHLPWGHYSNAHTHYSLAMHIGTSDHALSDEILAFLSERL